jgi:hypothetical protein
MVRISICSVLVAVLVQTAALETVFAKGPACPAPQPQSPAIADLKAQLGTGVLGAQDLILLRNTVYARRGRTFVSPWIQEHFLEKTPWYYPDPHWRENCTDKEEEGFVKEVLKTEATLRKAFDTAYAGSNAVPFNAANEQTCLHAGSGALLVEGNWSMGACRLLDCADKTQKGKADKLSEGASVSWKGRIDFPDQLLPLSMRVTITEITTCEPFADKPCATKPADVFLFCWLNPGGLGCDFAPLKTVELGAIGEGAPSVSQPLPLRTIIQATLSRYMGCWKTVP